MYSTSVSIKNDCSSRFDIATNIIISVLLQPKLYYSRRQLFSRHILFIIEFLIVACFYFSKSYFMSFIETLTKPVAMRALLGSVSNHKQPKTHWRSQSFVDRDGSRFWCLSQSSSPTFRQIQCEVEISLTFQKLIKTW